MLFREEGRPTVSRTSCLVLLLLMLMVLPGWLRPGAAVGQAVDEGSAPSATTPAEGQDTSPAGAQPNPFAPAAAPPSPLTPGGTQPNPFAPGGAADDPADPFANPLQPATRQGKRQAKVIKIFKLKHRDPQSLAGVIEGVLQMVHRLDQEERQADVVILATLPRENGYGGDMYGGAGKSGGYGGEGDAFGSDMGGYGGYDEMMGGGAPGMGKKDALGPALHLAADSRTGALIARGSSDWVEAAALLIRAFDTPGDHVQTNVAELERVRLLSLQHRSVEEMVHILRGIGIPVHITYGANAYSRTPLVAIGEAQEIEQVIELIGSLDVEVDKESPRPR